LGNIFSDCVCEESAKFPEDLFEETIYKVPLRQYLSHVCYKVLQWWRKTLGSVA